MAWEFKLMSTLRALKYARLISNRTAITGTFNIMGIVFMIIALALGSLIGSMVASWLGIAGGIIGSMLVGFIIYAIWAFLTGQKIRIWAGLIFAIMVWVANIIAGAIQGATGFGGGLMGYVIVAVILSFIWGKFGKGMAGTGKARRGRRRKR